MSAGWLGRWITPPVVTGLSVLSLVLLMASLLGVPWLVARLPADYFERRAPRRAIRRKRDAGLAAAARVGKNLLGLVLLVAGILMLALPGQGLLTIVAGLFLLEFPGKFRFLRWLVTRPGVLRVMNRMRERNGRPPLRIDDRDDR